MVSKFSFPLNEFRASGHPIFNAHGESHLMVANLEEISLDEQVLFLPKSKALGFNLVYSPCLSLRSLHKLEALRINL